MKQVSWKKIFNTPGTLFAAAFIFLIPIIFLGVFIERISLSLGAVIMITGIMLYFLAIVIALIWQVIIWYRKIKSTNFVEINKKITDQIIHSICGILILIGFFVPLYQILDWLKNGSWKSLSIISALVEFNIEKDWATYPTTWIGLHKFLNIMPISLGLVFTGFSIMYIYDNQDN